MNITSDKPKFDSKEKNIQITSIRLTFQNQFLYLVSSLFKTINKRNILLMNY